MTQALALPQDAAELPEKLSTRKAQALVTPLILDRLEQVARDFKAAAPADAVLDAQEELDVLQAHSRSIRGLKPAEGKLIFGSDQAWRDACSRLGVEIGKKLTVLSKMQRDAGMEPDFEQVESRTTLGWTGD